MKKILLMLFSIIPLTIFSQVNVAYKPTRVANKIPIVYYSPSSCSGCNDTIVKAEAITIFYIENPTEDDESMNLLPQLLNLKELWLAGNDADYFENFTNKDFKKIISSPFLKTIYLTGIIYNTELLRSYVRKRRGDIEILDFP